MAVESKAANPESDEDGSKRRARLLKLINISVLQSVAQHVITLQSEPMLMDQICKGDQVRSALLLSNTSSFVGVLSIIVNQVGGKLSDALGRKPCLLLGPLGNMILGALAYANHSSKSMILWCRILRMTITTFSNTVIVGAMMGDSLSGKEQAIAGSTIAATVGFAVSAVPFVEGSILARTKNPRLTFLLLSLLGAVQLAFNSLSMPETLEHSKRVAIDSALTLSTFNPLGFLNLYRKGSVSLQKGVTITTLQGFIEGKNLSDFALAFMKVNMNWGIAGIRNWLSLYGLTNFVSGMLLTPYLLKNLTVRSYTSLTNLTNTIAYAVRAFVGGRTWLYISTVPIMLPGVNGVSANALKAVASDLAKAEGFGMGEFSAYGNNLRAIISALAPVILGNFYSWSQKKGFGGSTYWLVGVIAGVIPQILFQNMTDDELEVSSKT